MFEKFFGKKEVENETRNKREAIVADFVEDSALEELVRVFNTLVRNRIAYAHDGPREKFEEAETILRNAENGEMGEKLRAYLRPYIEKENLPKDAFNVPRNEYGRWYAASILRSRK